MPREDRTPPWSRRERWAALFFLAFLGAQVAIPALRLPGRKDARFSWQMYGDASPGYRRTVVLEPSGEVWPVHPLRHVWWSDFGFEEGLAEHLCRTRPGVRAVRITAEAPLPAARYACPR